jgi:beta-mannosidase
MHLWFGWYGGAVADLASFASTLPRQVRFVSAFGAQALPEPANAPEDLAVDGKPDWGALAEHGVEVEVLRRVLPLEGDADIDAWANASRAHQADVVRRTVETLRRVKYRPTGGFSVHRLVDPPGRIGFGLLDNQGRPKPAFDALRAACRPLAVIADPLPARLDPGDKLDLAVHIVSDERVDREDCDVHAVLRAATGERLWHWRGDVGADTCALVGRVRWTAPSMPGPVALELRLVVSGETVHENRYRSRVL